jgi:chemotaxis protein MotB
MTRRARQEEEQENHERWLVSYADFITLLFAFFVVMYAISSVNDGKYRVLSDSLTSAFRSGESVRPQAQTGSSNIITPVQIVPRRASQAEDNVRRERRERARKLVAQAMSALDAMVSQGQVQVSEGARGITIEINSSMLFASGDSTLSSEAEQVLRAIAGALIQGDFPITVEGHSDNTPIATSRFASNWELSAVRAASVARLLAESGLAPGQLSAIGYGDQRPLESNATPEGRTRNRRVAILIESLAPEARSEGLALPSSAPRV